MSMQHASETFSKARFEYEFGGIGGYGSCSKNYVNRGGLTRDQKGALDIQINDCLKYMCKEKGLQVLGKRYDLVLHLLQTESGWVVHQNV